MKESMAGLSLEVEEVSAYNTLLNGKCHGCGPEEILLKYPSLALKDIYAVLTYYFWHREAIEAYLEERGKLAEEMRAENETRFPMEGVRKP